MTSPLGPVRWPASARPVDEAGAAVVGVTWSTHVDARLTWEYSTAHERLAALYEQGKRGQWNASTDVDWTIEVDWGAPLGDGSDYSRSAFETSVLARGGPELWDRFQWEFQAWMVSQFLHGEQGAMVASARLAETLPDLDAKLFAVNQAGDEARHVEVFSRYLATTVPEPYPVSDALASLLGEILTDERWDVLALGMQIMIEALAMAAFRLANSTFHDRLITSITDLVIRDEARHVSFGILSLERAYADLTDAERREREDFVLDASSLILRRFLLEEIWVRLGVAAGEGIAFARENEMMVRYRQTIFSKVVSALNRIGLLTPRLVEGLGQQGLLSPTARFGRGGFR